MAEFGHERAFRFLAASREMLYLNCVVAGLFQGNGLPPSLE